MMMCCPEKQSISVICSRGNDFGKMTVLHVSLGNIGQHLEVAKTIRARIINHLNNDSNALTTI